MFLLLPVVLISEDFDHSHLYRVSVLSHRDAEILSTLDVDPILRVRDGYLVMGSEEA